MRARNGTRETTSRRVPGTLVTTTAPTTPPTAEQRAPEWCSRRHDMCGKPESTANVQVIDVHAIRVLPVAANGPTPTVEDFTADVPTSRTVVAARRQPWTWGGKRLLPQGSTPVWR